MLRFLIELIQAKLARKKSKKDEGDGPRSGAPITSELDCC